MNWLPSYSSTMLTVPNQITFKMSQHHNDFYDNNSSSTNFTFGKFDTQSNSSNSGGGLTHTMDSRSDNPMLTTAMPIPRSRIMADFSDFTFDFDQSQSPQMSQDHTLIGGPGSALSNHGGGGILYGIQSTSLANTTTDSNAMWSVIGDAIGLQKQEPFRMDDDDIFQVDKADLFQGPTLAELNDDTILEDLNIDDFILQDDNSTLILSNHPTLTTLQPSGQGGVGSLILPPHQLLQSNPHSHHHHHQHQQHHQQQHHHHHHQQQDQQQQQQHENQTPQLNIQKVSIGQDVLYDDQTNHSTSPYDLYRSTPTKSLNSSAAFSPGSHTSSNSPLLINSISPPLHGFTNSPGSKSNSNNSSATKTQYSTLQELLKKESSMSPEHSQLGQSVPGPSSSIHMTGRRHHHHNHQQDEYPNRLLHITQQQTSMSRLSSSAPTSHSSSAWENHQLWVRREPRQHLLSTGSLAEAGSTSSLSTGGILSPDVNDFSHDEGYDDSDSDHYEDYSTDGENDDNDETPRSSGSKKERFFWQYNVQAKGPKGQRLVIKTKLEDPHVLNEVTDPVFSPNCSVRGIKHSGKARKGDGNDLTPNPRKLYSIGKELDKLGRTINDMTPVSELPFNVRPKSRKEKNKLASRACRLKKKAQHEANKIKLYGLETEHKRLIQGIQDIKSKLAYKCGRPQETNEEIMKQIDNVAKTSTRLKIAGTSTEFVNKILEKVKAGVPTGGLEEI